MNFAKSSQDLGSAGVYQYARLDNSPVGPLWAAVGPFGLVAVEFDCTEVEFLAALQRLLQRSGRDGQFQRLPSSQMAACQQISEYLSGQRQSFDLPIDWNVLTGFQRAALQVTFAIPYGRTTTYAAIASRLGKPRAARAVGRAEATNPMPLVLPCHRVLGTDGKLHGYGGPGGIGMKEWLLALESQSSQ
jgi:O-6-methylguanine DNA methyltransferase